MSLYDDIDEGGVGTKPIVPGWSSGYKLLQSHVQAKKASSGGGAKKQRSSGTILAPVIDLKRSDGSEMHFNTLTGRLESMAPLTPPILDNNPFVPVISAPSITGVLDEYNPICPNEYDDLVKKKKEQKQRERDEDRKRDEEQRSSRRKEKDRERYSRPPSNDGVKEFEQLKKRLDEEEEESYEDKPKPSGAAIAPPMSLIEGDVPPPEEDEDPDRPNSPSFGYSIGVGGSVASRIMAKYGYKEGQGLGKKEQGMSTALYVEKTSKRGGKIIHERDMAKDAASKEAPTNTNLLKNPSKVILLRNMVGPGEVDEYLETETAEECTKYGKVTKVLIFEIPEQTDDEAVRIFIEFERVESAIKAIVDLNGRFFGGRIVKGTFYNLDKFRRLNLSETIEEG